MPAAKRYYTAGDVMQMLCVSKDTAYDILHSFAAKGQLYQQGRVLRVRVDYFEKYLKETEERSKGQLSPRFARKEA